jgi:serine/threonine protein kinase
MLESLDKADSPAVALPFAPGGDLLEETDLRGGHAYGLLAPLAHLHGNNVIQRDIKPETCL